MYFNGHTPGWRNSSSVIKSQVYTKAQPKSRDLGVNTYSLDDDFDYDSQTESEYNSGPRDTSFHVI